MKSLFAITSTLLLISTSSFARTSFYCADLNQDIQYTELQALITLDGKANSYKSIAPVKSGQRLYANHEIQVAIDVQDTEVISSTRKVIGLCVNGVQNVDTNTTTQNTITVEMDEMEVISSVVVCEIKKSELEYCN